MKRIGEGPYTQEMDEYDRREFHIEPDEDVPLDIKSDGPVEREDLEAVGRAASLEEALQEYDSFYPSQNIRSGKLSPQYGLEMLLQIRSKFIGKLSKKEERGITIEAIDMCHAIDDVANKPANEKRGDRTTLKGMFEIAEVIPLAQEYAPGEVEDLEEILRKVAAKVESRVEHDDSSAIHPISGPIMVALEEFDKNGHDKPFENIHERLEHENLNESVSRLDVKLDKEERERRTRQKAKANAAAPNGQEFVDIMEELAKAKSSRIVSPIDQKLANTKAQAFNQPETAAAMSLEELEADEDDDSKRLVGVK